MDYIMIYVLCRNNITEKCIEATIPELQERFVSCTRRYIIDAKIVFEPDIYDHTYTAKEINKVMQCLVEPDKCNRIIENIKNKTIATKFYKRNNEYVTDIITVKFRNRNY